MWGHMNMLYKNSVRSGTTSFAKSGSSHFKPLSNTLKLAVLTTLFGLPAAWAQEDDVSRVTESMLEEIVVTSRKREEAS